MTEPYDTTPVQPPVQTKRPWYRKKRVLIPAGLLAAFVLIGVLVPSPDETLSTASPSATATPSVSPATPTETPAETPTGPTPEEVAAQAETDRAAVEQKAAEEAVKAEAARVAAEQAAAAEAAKVAKAEAARVAAEQAAAAEAAKDGTLSQQNAYDSARNYLQFKAFSRSGLVNQLSSEFGDGFPAADAEFAVARLEAESGVDWNEQAAKSAKSYLDFKSFSKSGLIEQLSSEFGEGFTQAQAEYGVSTTGL